MYQVLLADDDPVLHYILKRFDWKTYGFTVAAEVNDGYDVSRVLSSQKIDLMLTDIRMPGMNGMELLREMNEKWPSTCVILLSTYNDFEYAQRGIRYGIFDYLTKPVSPQELSASLRRVVDYFQNRITECSDNTLYQTAMDSLPEYFTIEKNPSNIILGICTFVTENVEKDVRLETVASALRLSRDYTGRVFKKKTGINFVEYVTRVKMERAKKLLSTSLYKNYEVSEKLGYRTPDYFTQLFKKYVGTTPLEYRLSMQKSKNV